MLQNIKEIGIFMIAAQAIVHFAPGKQYEKYIKSISAVIILALFLKPFVQMAGGQWQMPAAILERLEESVGMPDFSAVSTVMAENEVEDVVVRQMEEEIANRLNQELVGEPFLVRQVTLTMTKAAERSGEEVFSVLAEMGKREADSGEIAVKEITVGTPQTKEDEVLEAYCRRFAGILGLEKERVEVRWDGRD